MSVERELLKEGRNLIARQYVGDTKAGSHSSLHPDMVSFLERANSFLSAAAEPQPVAWMTPGGDVSRSKQWCEERCWPNGEQPTPLYAAPVPAQPVVWGQILEGPDGQMYREVLAAPQGDTTMDKGPWSADVHGDGDGGFKFCVMSDDFTHDVTLYINGDFASDEQKNQYAVWLANTLNENASLRAEVSEMKAQIEFVKDQATTGVFVEHDCPAMFACASIICEFEPPRGEDKEQPK